MRFFWISWVWFVVSPLALAGVTHPPFQVDNSTLEKSGVTVRVKDSGISTVKIADTAVTPAKLSAYNHVVASSASSYSNTYTDTEYDITNATLSFTASGSRPVMFWLQFYDADLNCYNTLDCPSGACSPGVNIYLYRGTTKVGGLHFAHYAAAASQSLKLPCNVITFLDYPAAGTYTYKLKNKLNDGRFQLSYAKLHALEL